MIISNMRLTTCAMAQYGLDQLQDAPSDKALPIFFKFAEQAIESKAPVPLTQALGILSRIIDVGSTQNALAKCVQEFKKKDPALADALCNSVIHAFTPTQNNPDDRKILNAAVKLREMLNVR